MEQAEVILMLLRENAEEKLVQEVKGNEAYKQATKPVFITDPGFVTISIDDGPSTHTERILDVLAEKKARAIFFMIGENAAKYPAIVHKVAQAGHVVGNHSYSHPFFTKISVTKQREELEKTSKLLADATGVAPTYFRPPYGAFNEGTLLLARQENMKVVMWSADPRDYSLNTASAVFRAVDPILASRKILLLHDLKEATVLALPRIIDDIRNKNLEVTTEYEH
jgi:peptidoglycan/xylan/chitin deacetylase (PgdA/CDA1 family)